VSAYDVIYVMSSARILWMHVCCVPLLCNYGDRYIKYVVFNGIILFSLW